jgi:hypothetical protein
MSTATKADNLEEGDVSIMDPLVEVRDVVKPSKPVASHEGSRS